MHVLIVDDEVGIREGLASFLRLAGHRVRTAERAGEALALIDEEDFDVIVTDWRLVDDSAAAVVERASCPCIVVSGHPDDVSASGPEVQVLSKPVRPDRLLELIEANAVPIVVLDAEMSEPPELPADTAARVELVRSVCESVETVDDGEFVTVRAALRDESLLSTIESCGGDLRVLAPKPHLRVELRLYRDGRPDGVGTPLQPADPWPSDDRAIVVDFDTGECTPREFVEILDRTADARACGRDVWLLNVPNHLRLFVEALGRSEQLPKRPIPGPRLPEVLAELWS